MANKKKSPNVKRPPARFFIVYNEETGEEINAPPFRKRADAKTRADASSSPLKVAGPYGLLERARQR